MPLSDAVKLIRGPKGTRVRLTLIPAGAADDSARKTITLVRDEVKLEDQQAKARIVDLPQKNGATLRLGVIDLPSFYRSSRRADAPHAQQRHGRRGEAHPQTGGRTHPRPYPGLAAQRRRFPGRSDQPHRFVHP